MMPCTVIYWWLPSAYVDYYAQGLNRWLHLDSILTLTTVWSIWGKIIRTAIIVRYICTLWIGSSYSFRFRLFL